MIVPRVFKSRQRKRKNISIVLSSQLGGFYRKRAARNNLAALLFVSQQLKTPGSTGGKRKLK